MRSIKKIVYQNYLASSRLGFLECSDIGGAILDGDCPRLRLSVSCTELAANKCDSATINVIISLDIDDYGSASTLCF